MLLIKYTTVATLYSLESHELFGMMQSVVLGFQKFVNSL